MFVHHLALFAGVGAGLLGRRVGRRGREGDDEQDQGKESSGESPRVMFLHNVLLCHEWRKPLRLRGRDATGTRERYAGGAQDVNIMVCPKSA